MMFSYRVGWPGWKLAARLGITLRVKLWVIWDSEAKVFVAESDDFMPDFGCAAEAETPEGLRKELSYVFEDAFEAIFGKDAGEPRISTDFSLAFV